MAALGSKLLGETRLSFITTEDLSDYLGRDVSSDDGAEFVVDAACQIVRTLSEQDFTEETSTVTLDGTGTDSVFLPQRPVNTVGTVAVNGDVVTDFAFSDEGRLVRTSEDDPTFATWAQGYQSTAYWPNGRQNIEVTYEHGAGTVPSDVRMVALMIAHRMVTQGGNLKEQVGDVNRTYAVSSTDLTNGEKAILRKYRR